MTKPPGDDLHKLEVKSFHPGIHALHRMALKLYG